MMSLCLDPSEDLNNAISTKLNVDFMWWRQEQTTGSINEPQ